jgi:uncharacterized protein YegL
VVDRVAVPRRELLLVWVIDVSGSMFAGEHIESINSTMEEVLAALRDDVTATPGIDIVTRVLTFAEDTRWQGPPVPLQAYRWREVDAQGGALSELGRAVDAVTAFLEDRAASAASAPPVVVLLSDGRYTDIRRAFEDALADLLATAPGASAVRAAIAIGTDDAVDREALAAFASSDEHVLSTLRAPMIVLWLQQFSATLGPGPAQTPGARPDTEPPAAV